MKSLTQFNLDIINKNIVLESTDDTIIEEGFWGKLGSLFGGLKVKTINLSKEFKRGFTTGEYLATKSKNKTIKDHAKKSLELAQKDDKSKLKEDVNFINEIIKNKIKINESPEDLRYYFLIIFIIILFFYYY